MFTLRPYQSKLIDQTREAMRQGKRSPLLVSPCGSGKTVMFSYFCHSIIGKGKRVIVLAHRDELLDQISNTLKEFDVTHSFIAAGRPYNYKDSVHVASVFSAVRRLKRLQPPDVIIIDEAHHAIRNSTWDRVLTAFPKAWRIGVTATAGRTSGEPLKDIFDSLILGPTVSELIEIGSLCPYRIYVPSTINTENVHKRAGDYAQDELVKASDKPTITGEAVKEYEKLANGKRAIVFCCSIDHAKHVAEQFRANGHIASSVDGKMDKVLRRDIVKQFRDDKLKILTSCDVVSEGFDIPGIECAIMLRPTVSLILWIQQSGRALRPFPGKKEAIILDHSGNALRLGLPDDERQWSLEGSAKKKDDEKVTKIRVCKRCFAAQTLGALSCKFCGFVFEIQPREVKQVEGELSEIDVEAIRRSKRREVGMAKSYEDLVELAKQRKYANPHGYAWYVMQARRRKIMMRQTA